VAEVTKTVAGQAENNSPWIEIFRAGDYTAQGKAKITRADLERVIRNYDPSFHEAPVTVGHPKNDLPAFAWIDRLALNGDTLLAKEKQVDPQFNEARKAGRYKKRSAAFYQDADGNVTGLRHVGWLGAQPPEVKGLQNVNFEDKGREFITVDFGEEEVVADETKTMDERIRAFFAEMFTSKPGTATFSEADVKRIATEAVTAATAPLTAQITTLETNLKTQTTQFSEREKQFASGEVKQRATAAIGKLKAEGKWVPAFDKMGLDVVFDELAKTTTTIEFGEGDKKKTVTPLEALVLFMEGLPKIVPGGTHFTGQQSASAASGKGDPLSAAAYKRSSEKSISFSEAMEQIVRENPELVNAGSGTSGSV
jgi:hypothetical protein